MDVSLHRLAAVTLVTALAACGGGGRGDAARTADTGVAVSSAPARDTGPAAAAPAPTTAESAATVNRDTATRAMRDSTAAKGESPSPATKTSHMQGARAAHAAAKPSPSDTARAAEHGAVVAPTRAAKIGAKADTTAAKAAAAASDTGQKDTAKKSDTTGNAQAPSQQAEASGGEVHDKYHPAPLDTLTQDAYQGWKQFELNCSRCHGEYAVGSSFAPALVVSLKEGGTIPTKEAFIQTVCAGRPAKGMPSWCALGLGMDKINEIYAYVKGRADGKIHAGRPALKQ
jgi:hypothetical protein